MNDTKGKVVRRQFERCFKVDAVPLVTETGQRLSDVARQVGVTPNRHLCGAKTVIAKAKARLGNWLAITSTTSTMLVRRHSALGYKSPIAFEMAQRTKCGKVRPTPPNPFHQICG